MNIGKFAPQILTALGIVGMISTVVMAIKATPKCDELIAEAEERLREETEDNSAELDKKEIGGTRYVLLWGRYWRNNSKNGAF